MKDIKSIEEISQLGQDNKLYALVDGQFVLADEKLVAKNNCYVGDYDFDMNCLLDWLQTHNIEDYLYLSDSAGDIVRCNGRGFTTSETSGKILFFSTNSSTWSSWRFYTENNNNVNSTFVDKTSYSDIATETVDIICPYSYDRKIKYYSYQMKSAWLSSQTTTVTDSSGTVHALIGQGTGLDIQIRRIICELVFIQGKTLAEIQAMASSTNKYLTSNELLNATLQAGSIGTSALGSNCYFKRGAMVFVHLNVKNVPLNTVTTIFTLPVGYRPLYYATGIANCETISSDDLNAVWVETNGAVRVKTNHSKSIYGNITFIAKEN